MSREIHPIRVALGPISAADGQGQGHPEHGPTPAPPHPHPSTAVQTPPIDIHEGPEGLVLEADLPGATEETVSIQLEDNVLTLHARVAATSPEAARTIHQEYRVADFHRSFILSDEFDRTQIRAELRHGVLRLTLPRAERAKTRRIEIRTN